jgi:hypothetical protein
MDTKTLVVGQKVWVRRSFYCFEAEVVKVTPAGARVRVVYEGILHCDNNGWGYSENGPFKVVPVLDTTKLVVGQEVSISSGVMGGEGRVVKVSPEGVEVEIPSFSSTPFHFDSTGKGRDDEGTFENGAYYLDEMPYEERKAWWDKKTQKYKDEMLPKMLPFITWWKTATYKQRLVIVKKRYDFLSKYNSQSQSAEDVAKIDISTNLWLASVLEPYWKTSEMPLEPYWKTSEMPSEQIKGEPR